MKFNFKIMNDPTSFQPVPDGWFHIAPHGTFPHPNGALQVIDAEACEAMLGTFNEEARRPNFPGLLVDFDHSSHDPAQPTTAAGWIGGLEHRDDGLYAQIRWSDLGHKALTAKPMNPIDPNIMKITFMADVVIPPNISITNE